MDVTVAICTWNRAKLLDQTLTRMNELRIPTGINWELLVVNNNCTDETDQVIQKHRAEGRLPLVRLFEPKPGLSNARNCAISHFRGELLIWTDDDVLVEPNWVEEYLNAANRHPDASFFGGTIEPLYETPPPKWVSKNLALLSGTFAILDLGRDVRPFQGDEVPFGANMAFRAQVMRSRPFNTAVGRIGAKLLSGEETAYCEALVEQGRTGIWVGTAAVRHHVPTERLQWDYVRQWFFSAGVSAVRTNPPPGPFWLGVPRYMWKMKIKFLGQRLVNTLFFFRSSKGILMQSIRLDGSWRELRERQRAARATLTNAT